MVKLNKIAHLQRQRLSIRRDFALRAPAPALADAVPAEQPQQKHHVADLRTPEQADAARMPHPDRAAAAVHLAQAASIVLFLDLEAERGTALDFLLQVWQYPKDL